MDRFPVNQASSEPDKPRPELIQQLDGAFERIKILQMAIKHLERSIFGPIEEVEPVSINKIDMDNGGFLHAASCRITLCSNEIDSCHETIARIRDQF